MRSLLILLSAILISCSHKKSNELQVKKSDITESVYASGIVKSIGQYTVFSTVNGILKKTNVIVGQKISKDQLIFELDSDKAKLNEANSKLVYDLSQSSSRYIQDKIADMELRVLAWKIYGINLSVDDAYDILKSEDENER